MMKLSSYKIRTKVVGLILAIILSLTLVNLAAVRSTLRHALADQLEQRAVSIARDTASRSIDLILTNNRYALHRLARDTLENNSDLRYVFFTDGRGNILSHTFDEGFPADLLDANRIEENQSFNLNKFQTEEGVLRDIAVPVFDEMGELVRIGILEHSLLSALDTATWQMILISLLTFLCAGMLVYLLTTYTAIRPINALLDMVRAVSAGDLAARVSVDTGDELSELAGAFNQMTGNLDKYQKSRTMLIKKIIDSQEDVRRKIARELHDETGQSLATLLIGLQLIEEAAHPDELKLRTAEFRRLLLHSLENVRLLAWQMSPIPLADLGLQAALEELFNKYKHKEGWTIKTDLKGLDTAKLAPETETAVYRVIQEALTNTVKHAAASEVSLRVCPRGSDIEVIFKDNGKGFTVRELANPDMKKHSLGLASMDERIAITGGTLLIESSPAEGTVIHCRVPIHKSGGENDG